MKIKSMFNLRVIIIAFLLLNIISAIIMIKQKGFHKENIVTTANVLAADAKTDKKDSADAAQADKAVPAEEDNEKKEKESAKLELEGLEAKRISLQEEETRIKEEKANVLKLKKELEEKIAKLTKIHKDIEISLEKLNKKKSEKQRLQEAKETRKINQLVKLYTSMKPKQAGMIINNMDIVIAEKIFMHMKGDAAGKILSYVESEKAARISERIADMVTNIEGSN